MASFNELTQGNCLPGTQFKLHSGGVLGLSLYTGFLKSLYQEIPGENLLGAYEDYGGCLPNYEDPASLINSFEGDYYNPEDVMMHEENWCLWFARETDGIVFEYVRNGRAYEVTLPEDGDYFSEMTPPDNESPEGRKSWGGRERGF